MKSERSIQNRCSDFKLISLALNILTELKYFDEKYPELLENKKLCKLVEMSKKWGDMFVESIAK